MLERIRRLPSPALVISAIALVVAIGGGTYAIAALNGAKVKRISKRQADKEIKRKAHGLSVAHATTAANATHAATADTAAHATSADSATSAATVGGMTVQKFSSKPPEDTPLTRLVTAGTLDLRVGCDSSGNPLFTIAPPSGTAPQGVRGSFDDGTTKSNTIAAGTLTAGNALNVLNVPTGTTAAASGDINAATAAGQVTTIHWVARSAVILFPGGGNPDPGKCFFYGTAVSG